MKRFGSEGSWLKMERTRRILRVCASGLLACLLGGTARAQGTAPADDSRVTRPRLTTADEAIRNVRLDQKLDAQVPLDIPFRDETGKAVRFGDYFHGKPVMLNLIQYRCRMLCSTEMEVLVDSLRQLQFSPGKQFELVTVSIDDREQADLAMDYKKGYLEKYGRPEAAPGWHFLTGDKTAIQRLAAAIGYRFT